jgi:putative flippase GtrA
LLSGNDTPLLIRYLAAGALNTCISFAVIILGMMAFGMSPPAANATGFGVGLLTGYMIHKRYTFRSTVAHIKGMLSFLAVALIGFGVNMAVLVSLVQGGVGHVWAQILAVGTYVLITFFLNKTFVYKTRN